MTTSTEDPEQAAVLWNNAGVCALRMYDADRAVECFRCAVDAASQLPAGRARLSKIYAHLTAAYYESSRMREAWGAAYQGLLLAEETGDAVSVSRALSNLGLAERYLGEWAEALKLFSAARRGYQGAGEAGPAAEALHNMAGVYLDRDDLETGEQALRDARAEKAALGLPVARIDLELARVALKRGSWLAALAHAVEIAESIEAAADPMTRLQALTLAAEAAEQDDLQAAFHYAGEAMALAMSLGRPPVLFDLMPVIVRLRANAGLPLTEEERILASEMFERRHGVQGRITQTSVTLN